MYLVIKFAPKGKGPGFVDEYADQLIDSQRNEKIETETPSDFIGKFMAIQQENPAKIKDKDIRNSAFANIAAGSDTTSMTLSGILYHLIKNPRAMERLRRELDYATIKGTISDPITFQEAQALPYLQAVIKEGLRSHPAVGFTMPRVVPKGGRGIIGWEFPAGVGLSSHSRGNFVQLLSVSGYDRNQSLGYSSEPHSVWE
jgi:cytochrome P450